MPDLQIELTPSLIRAIIKALDDLAIVHGDDLREMLYESGECLAQVAGEVDALRTLEKIADERNLTDNEMDALNKTRNQTVSSWMRKKAGQILVTLAQPMRGQIAAHDGAADDRPGQDAGAALVGVECVFSDNGEDWSNKARCDTFDSKDSRFPYSAETRVTVSANNAQGYWWKHARPAYLGVPA